MPIRSRGFTLLEVLIAIALMAVLALLSWQGLDSVLRTRERLTQSSDELKSLTICFAQIEEDLRRAWPVRLFNLPVAPIRFAAAQMQDGIAPLELLRELPAGATAGAVQRVTYRLRDGVFERGFAPWVLQGSADEAAAAAQTWQPLVTGVVAMRMRGFVTGVGWVEGATLAAQPPPLPVPPAPGIPLPVQPAPTLVSGLEVVMERTRGDTVTRIFSIKD